MATFDTMLEQLFHAPPPRRRQHRAVAIPQPFAGLFGDVTGREAPHGRGEDKPPPPAAGTDSRSDQGRQHSAAVAGPFAGLFGDVLGREASHSRGEDKPPPPAAGTERPPPRPEVRMKQCSGIADTPCEQQIPASKKRCPTCTAENRRLQRQSYNRDYSQKNREPINVKRNDRRRKAREHAAATVGAAPR